MAINPSDIKLLESERMTDTADGGGRRTSRVIVDGAAGNIFPKVSRLDSVYGRVNLRKVFTHVDTLNTDIYAGAHVAIIDDADNDRIKVNIFTTGSDFDDRTAARDRIESFVVSGPESRMWLYGRQLAGQQAITCVQRVEDTLPEVGDVYCLSRESGGVITYQQYVRVEDVQHETRKFTDASGDYERRIVTLKLSAALRNEFVGLEEMTRMSVAARSSIIRNTNVADASRYFGISKIAEVAAPNSLTIKVDSIYSNLVPTTQRESPVSNASIGGAAQMVPSSLVQTDWAMKGDVFLNGDFITDKATTFSVGHGITPGSLQVYMGAENTAEFNSGITTDNGAGVIPASTRMEFARSQVLSGVVDYQSGTITLHGSWFESSNRAFFHIRYTPAVPISQPAHMLEKPVTLNTRGTVYVLTLAPLSAKGSLYIDYRAMGKWYRLRDDGTGQIKGDDPAYGTGTVDFATGAVVVTLGALPDVGSSVLFGWASPAHYAIKAGASSDAGATVKQKIVLTDLPVKAQTVVVKYTAGVTLFTASENVAGVISGGGITGTINHVTGELNIEFTSKLPNAATAVTVEYQQEVPTTAEPKRIGGEVTVTDPAAFTLEIGASSIAPGGLRLSVPVEVTPTEFVEVTLLDDGNGNLKTYQQFVASGTFSATVDPDQIIGTINYATGAVSITAQSINWRYFFWTNKTWAYVASAGG